MAIGIDSIGIKGLRKAHFTQLMSYLVERDKTEWHYGSQVQFEKRHQDLLDWIENINELLSETDVRIAK